MANNNVMFQTLQQSVPAGKVLMRAPGSGTGPLQLVDVSELAAHITAAGAASSGGGGASGFPSSPVQGDILYYNGSAWVALAPGTSGQVLETQGASANPIWAAAGGGLSLVATQTASASTTLAFTGLNSAHDYLLLFDNLLLTSGSANLGLQFGTGATPIWQTTSYRYQQNFWGSGGNNGTNISESATLILLTGMVTSGSGANGSMTIRGPLIYGQDNSLASDTHDYVANLAGRWTGGSSFTAVRLLLDAAGTIASGTAKLYQYA